MNVFLLTKASLAIDYKLAVSLLELCLYKECCKQMCEEMHNF